MQAAQNKSGLRFHFYVWVDGNSKPLDITTGPADVVFWEKHSQTSFTNGASVEMMLWLAWRAGRRLGLVETKKFDDWVVTVDDFETLDEDEDGADIEPTPTQQAVLEN